MTTMAAPFPGVFPACAGMDRTWGLPWRSSQGVPRLRGDGPYQTGFDQPKLVCPPPARGWTAEQQPER